jgi:hypothetical protein
VCLPASDTTEIRFWDDVNINPFYMYLENTTELVDMKYVNKNMDIMNFLNHQTTQHTNFRL